METYTTDERLPPGEWLVRNRGEDRLEYGRSVEFWTGSAPVTVSAVRTSTGPLAGASGPLWELRVATGWDGYTSTAPFGYAGCRSSAEDALFEAMSSVDRLLDASEDGYLDHAGIREALRGPRPSRRRRPHAPPG